MHIPKTGGSSLRDSLDQVYPKREQLQLYDSPDNDVIHADDFAGLPEVERDRPRLIMGHFYYGLHEHVPRPSRYLTIIRDPVDRVASLYHHYRRVAELRPDSRAGKEGQAIVNEDMSLEDWGFGLERVEIDNEILRRVTGQQSIPFGQCPDHMLDEALDHVEERFLRVLVLERLDQSMRVLDADLGRHIPAPGFVNVNEWRAPVDAIDPKVVARLLELNRLDLAFYRAMVERLP
jgi:hypothetical protein